MKCKLLTIAVLLLMGLMIFTGAFSSFATGEEEVVSPTEEMTETVPVESVTATETVPVTATDVSDPTGSVVPSESSASTAPTETTVPVSRPTEFDESQPEDQTYSPYDATNSPIQAPSYNAGEENWGHIDYDDIGLDNNEAQAGKIDFSGVQKDTSTEDKRSYFFTNIAVVLLILAIIGITVFVLTFVLEANRKKKPQTASASKKQEKNDAKRRSAGHYRDGF